MTSALVLAILASVAVIAAVRFGELTGSAQDYPVLDAVANKIVQKYATSTCEQLSQEKSQPRPKTPQEQQVISLLQANPQKRAAFIDKVAAPIVNKMFECGMIP